MTGCYLAARIAKYQGYMRDAEKVATLLARKRPTSHLEVVSQFNLLRMYIDEAEKILQSSGG